MREIKFAGQLTFPEFRKIQRLVMRKFWLVCGIVIIALTAFNLVGKDWRNLFTDPYEIMSTWLPLSLIWLVLYPFNWYMQRRYWRKSQALHYPVTGVVSDEGITWNVETLSSSKFPWNLMLKCRVADSLVLVYISPNQVFYFPRRYFANDADWNLFKEAIISNLPRK